MVTFCIIHIGNKKIFLKHQTNRAKPDQTRQSAVSDQDLHFLLTECTFKI